MYKIIYRRLSQFRDSFVSSYGAPGTKSWFPGHMYKGILQMQAKLATVDCIIEVHDARIPFSGRNPKFYSMLTAIKPHILVLNKCDKIAPSLQKGIKEKLREQNIENVLFTNCSTHSKSGVSKIVPTVVEITEMSQKYSRGMASAIQLMIIGIPNVGKSSLINKLRNLHLKKKKSSTVGAIPGITRSVLEKIKISEDPLIYLFDTPGVLQPSIENLEVGLKLGLCRTIRDDLVGEELIADFLLYWLNKNKIFRYVDVLKLNKPIDDIRVLLLHIASENKRMRQIRNSENCLVTVPDFHQSSLYFIKCFREGKFGKIFLDTDYLNKVS